MSVSICGIPFQNPIIAASGTVGFCNDFGNLVDFSKIGGVSLKGLTLEKRQGNDGIRIAETASGIINSVGLQNPGIKDFILDYVPRLREQKSKKLNTVLIANIAGNTENDYLEITDYLDEIDIIDMIELNISCPNVKQGGIAFGIHPQTVERITSLVRRFCQKSLIVKLSPNVSSITDNAKAAENGGADCISLINTVNGLAVDLNSRNILVKGGLSGAAIKPIGLRQTYEVAQVTQLPIIGMGGIQTATDALEYIAVGATAVQVGTAIFNTPSVLTTIVQDMQQWLQKNNLQDINLLRKTIA